ncbi:MAG: acyl-CoA reductase [Clostridiales bacterium]|nr:acyl-CoA reductase [Clostridiales bacterium]
MQQSLNRIEMGQLKVLAGNRELCLDRQKKGAKKPFDETVLDWMEHVSKTLLHLPEAKQYPDVLTFAFFIRRASMEEQRKKYGVSQEDPHQILMGRGLVFHIAPSNVAVNFAYSLIAGMAAGNQNIVRLPSKEFPQVDVICRVLEETRECYPDIWSRFCLVRYPSEEKEITDALSMLCDVRMIWGGNETVAKIRESGIRPRAAEITFADRDSICVIDSDYYCSLDRKDQIAKDFYNDTYLSDQNACTSPRLVVWMGSRINEAKEEFWARLSGLVEKQYEMMPVQSMDKWSRACLLAAKEENVTVQRGTDNRLMRLELSELTENTMNYKGNSGYFMEYSCKDVEELAVISDEVLQTVSYIGNRECFLPLLESGISGIDRLVPVGKTMDFSFVWDGYRLMERLTRTILW